MTEAQLFESLGRKQIALELIQGDYNKLVAVMKAVKEGTIALNRLTINPDGTWSLGPEIKEPESVSP
jgi:hypothetical protein